MHEIQDIGWLNLLGFSFVLLLPLICFWRLGIGDLNKRLLIACARMGVQLILIGLYLRYLFVLNHLWINLAWLLVMVTIANWHIIRGARLTIRRLFWGGLSSLLVVLMPLMGLFMLCLVTPDPWFDARYLIPIAGILLGNCLNGNILALERFFTGILQQPE